MCQPRSRTLKLRYAFVHTVRHTHTHTHTHTRSNRSKPKVTGVQLAKSPRQSSASETGSDTNVSDDELQDRCQTGMCSSREDTRDRTILSSTDTAALSSVLNEAEADSGVKRGIDRQALADNCRVVSRDRNFDDDAGRLSLGLSRRSDRTDSLSARDSQ